MRPKLAIVIGTAGLIRALTSAPASAQMPNMDMSWGIQQQMRLQQQGDAYARAVAMQYYQTMLRMRQAGYTGPSLPTGVTPQSLSASIQRLQNSMDAYHAGSRANSDRTHRAVNRWDYQAIRGCSWVPAANGSRVWFCP